MSASDLLSQSAAEIFGQAMQQANGKADIAAMRLAERVRDAEERAEQAMAALRMLVAQGGGK